MVAFGALTSVAAQELTPRAYWPAPKGINVVVAGYSYSFGDIVTDPTLPVAGVDSSLHGAVVGYQRSFGLAGRSASFLVSVPSTWGSVSGLLEGIPRRVDVSGPGDARLRLAVNLMGAPAMDPQGFQQLRSDPRPLLGVSLLVAPPTGDYDDDRLINVGTNRWAVKPALGYIYPIRPTWLAEFELGVWLFQDNDEFVGVTREQDPIYSGEFHLIKRIRPGFWASLDLNYYGGGRTTVDGDLRADFQRNSRGGFTVVFPFHRTHAVKGSFSTGVLTESGGDWDTFQLSYQHAWR